MIHYCAGIAQGPLRTPASCAPGRRPHHADPAGHESRRCSPVPRLVGGTRRGALGVGGVAAGGADAVPRPARGVVRPALGTAPVNSAHAPSMQLVFATLSRGNPSHSAQSRSRSRSPSPSPSRSRSRSRSWSPTRAAGEAGRRVRSRGPCACSRPPPRTWCGCGGCCGGAQWCCGVVVVRGLAFLQSLLAAN